jgi:hypothetical protein
MTCSTTAGSFGEISVETSGEMSAEMSAGMFGEMSVDGRLSRRAVARERGRR